MLRDFFFLHQSQLCHLQGTLCSVAPWQFMALSSLSSLLCKECSVFHLDYEFKKNHLKDKLHYAVQIPHQLLPHRNCEWVSYFLQLLMTFIWVSDESSAFLVNYVWGLWGSFLILVSLSHFCGTLNWFISVYYFSNKLCVTHLFFACLSGNGPLLTWFGVDIIY